MRKVIDFVDVSTEGLESSPYADALALGLAAREDSTFLTRSARDSLNLASARFAGANRPQPNRPWM